MAKKNLGGLDALIQDSAHEQKEDIIQEKIIKKTKESEQPVCFILRSSLIEKIKAIAYWERKKIKIVANEAISEYISKYEEKKEKLNQYLKLIIKMDLLHKTSKKYIIVFIKVSVCFLICNIAYLKMFFFFLLTALNK